MAEVEVYGVGHEKDQIDPFSKLLEDVRENLTPKELDKIWRLVEDKIPDSFRKEDGSRDIDELFSILRKTRSEDVAVKLLKNAFATAEYHYTASGEYSGRPILEIFEDYEEDVKKWKATHGMKRDNNFVGRAEYIKEITEAIHKVKCVTICGLGGMGKTSLATEICWLFHYNYQFSIIKVNMRGVVNTQKMLEKLLSKLGVTQPEEDMLNHLRTHINTIIKRDTIVFLDEVDELMPSGTEEHFLNQFKELLDGLENVKVKFLLTSRYKLIHPDDLECGTVCIKVDRFSGQLQEFELKKLDDNEAADVLRKRLSCYEVDKNVTEQQLKQLAEICHGIPLALLMVEDQLHSGVAPNVIIDHLQSGHSQFNDSEKVSKIINEHFKSLPMFYHGRMIQLSVFCSTFTLQAASSVLDRKHEDTEIDLYRLKSRHLVEIEDTSKLENDCDQSNKRTNSKQHIVFSLHPLIQKYLREIISTNKKFKSLKEKAELRFLKYFDEFLGMLALEAEVDCLEATRTTFDQIHHISQALNNMEKLDLPNISGREDYLQALKKLRFMVVIYQGHSTRLEHFQRMAELAKLRTDNLWYMTMQCWVADHYMLVDQYRGHVKANEILEEIKKQVESMYEDGVNNKREGLVLLYALYCYVRARVYKSMQNFSDALKDTKTSRSIFKKHSKHDLQLARAYNLSGHIYHLMNESEKALKYHEKAYSKLAKKGNHCGHYFDLVEYTMNIGSCYHRKGQELHDTAGGLEAAIEDYQRALQWYKRSLKIHEDMNMAKSSRTYNVLVNLTSLCIDMKDFNMALEYAEDGKQIAMAYKAGNPIDQVKSIITVGHIYRMLAEDKEMNNSDQEVTNPQRLQMSEQEFYRAMEMIQNKHLKASDIGGFRDLSIGYPEVLEALGLADKLNRMTKLLHDMTIGCTISADQDDSDSSSSTSDSNISCSPSTSNEDKTHGGDAIEEQSETYKRKKEMAENKEELDSDSSTSGSPLKRPRKSKEDESSGEDDSVSLL